MLAAGPTADAIQAHLARGSQPAWLHALVGHGPATGMGTLFLIAAITGIAVAVAGTRSSALRTANAPSTPPSRTPPTSGPRPR